MRWILLGLLSCLGVARAEDAEGAFDAAKTLLEERYPDVAPDADLYRAAIDGMARYVDEVSGTRGSRVLTEAQHAAVQAWMRGERNGLGVEVLAITPFGMRISRVYPGTPAERAGLVPGDLIVAINGAPLTGLGQDAMGEVLQDVQQRAEGDVVLDVRREGVGLRRFAVPRGAWRINPVRACDGYDGCLLVSHFGVGAAAALRAALEDMDPRGGLVLDLRGNPGGPLDEAVAAADLFLEVGEVVVITVAADDTSHPIAARAAPAWTGRVAVVVDGGTRGTAEAFAAALRDHNRAALVGLPTGGIATTDSWHRLGGGLVLQLADTRLRTPTGLSWAGQGLRPDQFVEPPEVMLGGDSLPALPDLQLDTGLRLIRGP